MEDVLDLYHLPYDPARPLVCFDESNKQLLDEVRESYPLQPGQPLRYDYEYVQKGSRNLETNFFRVLTARMQPVDNRP